jgi:penicillin amidase
VRIGTRPTSIEIDGRRIELSRTEDGVACVRADDALGLAAGTGFFHAHDRMLQMALVRLIGQGRLAECLRADDETVAIDTFMHGMAMRDDAEADAARLSEPSLALSTAYAAGVNAYFARRERPLELWLVGHRPEPWRVADTLLTVKLMSYAGLAQSQQDLEKLIIEAVRAGVDLERLRALFAPHLDGMSDTIVGAIRAAAVPSEPLLGPLWRAAPRLVGSNAWVVAGRRTASGTPILSCDPHLECNRLPGLWYEVALEAAGESWLGVSMPGLPGLVLGRNRRLAWSFTYGFMDQVDYFVEEVKDGKVRRGERWEPLVRRTATVRRKSKPPLERVFFESDHGTLEVDPALGRVDDGLHLCRAWAGRTNGAAPSLEGILALQRVTTVEEAQRVIRGVGISSNWLFADAEGHIGYQQAGRAPRRAHSGLHPVLGWDPASAWRGFVSPEELATALDPDEGFIASANDDVDRPGCRTINACQGSDRLDRIRELVGGAERLDPDAMERIQGDVYSAKAARYLALLAPLLPAGPGADLLRAWDCRYDVESRAAPLFERIQRSILEEVFGRGLLGEALWRDGVMAETCLWADYFHLFDDALLGDDPRWFGERGRDAVFREAARAVLEAAGPGPYPTWGEYHPITMKNLLLGGQLPGFLGFDRGPFGLPGSNSTIVQGALFRAYGRDTSFAPSWRFITDLGSTEARTVLAGGPSARRFSRHYATDVERWLGHRYKRLRLLAAKP